MLMKEIKLTNMENFLESYHSIFIFVNKRYKTIYADALIDCVKYEGRTFLKNGCEISPSYYPKKFEKFFTCDHTIVKYDFYLHDEELQQEDNYKITIYADLGQEDPANPDPEKILFIENEEELKKYIADLIYEEENPWWDREEG